MVLLLQAIISDEILHHEINNFATPLIHYANLYTKTLTLLNKKWSTLMLKSITFLRKRFKAL